MIFQAPTSSPAHRMALVGLVCSAAGLAHAQSSIATANSTTRNVSPFRHATGTTGQVLAFSEANGLDNEDVQEDNTTGLGDLGTRYWNQGNPYYVGTRSWQPVWTTGQRELDPNEYISIYSHTDHLGADAFGSATVSRGSGSDKLMLVYADVNGVRGRAFAAAADPMYFTSGDLTITDTLGDLDLSVLGSGSESGYYMEMKSSVPDYEHLYALQIVADADSGLDITFDSNELLGWDDDLIIQSILDDIVYDGLTYSLSSPLEFQFTIPDPGHEFSIDFLSGAFGATVPGPGVGSLFAAGVLVAFGRRRR